MYSPNVPSDNEQVLDYVRQQVRYQLEREQQALVEEEGWKGVRSRLADVIEDAERLDDFPDHVLSLLKVTYDVLWQEMQ